MEYKKNEARDWAMEKLKGVSGVTNPSFTADLSKLNRKAIAHDMQLLESFGYGWTLIMAETNITPEENAEFTAIAKEAAPNVGLFFHAAFQSVDENIHAANLAAKSGVDIVLLSYPPQFAPTTEQEIFDYTKKFCDEVDLAVMLFSIPQWGFERVHPAGMPVHLVRKMIDEIPNVVAIKAEQGYPQPIGIAEMHYHFRDEIVISHPIEDQCLPLMDVMDIPFSGTSNTQWMSDYYPTVFNLARNGQWVEAMEKFWSVMPARNANNAVGAGYMPAIQTLNRTSWKYQDWLAGFNGGPLRKPMTRLPDRWMPMLRNGLKAAGLPCTDDPDEAFLVGRNPA